MVNEPCTNRGKEASVKKTRLNQRKVREITSLTFITEYSALIQIHILLQLRRFPKPNLAGPPNRIESENINPLIALRCTSREINEAASLHPFDGMCAVKSRLSGFT